MLRLMGALTTPLLPDDYLGYLNPLWSTREPRGIVDAVLPETPSSATLWLRTPRGFPAHRAGQYVRVGVDVEGVRHWRTYSLTSLAGRRDRRIAITVKAIDEGRVSNQLVHRTRAGAVVRLAPPAGEFVLPDPPPSRVLFVTAGSGITPVLGMLRDLVARRALPDVVHVHLAPSAAEAICADELRRIAAQHFSYRLVEHHDDRDGLFDVAGLDAEERAIWACGPSGLLDALAERFADVNVERFRPVVAAVRGDGGTVTFTRSGKTVEADGATPLLEAGEAAGALLPSGCRMGICRTCVGRLCSGAVRDLRTGELHQDEGLLVQTCVSAAAGPVAIDL